MTIEVIAIILGIRVFTNWLDRTDLLSEVSDATVHLWKDHIKTRLKILQKKQQKKLSHQEQEVIHTYIDLHRPITKNIGVAYTSFEQKSQDLFGTIDRVWKRNVIRPIKNWARKSKSSLNNKENKVTVEYINLIREVIRIPEFITETELDKNIERKRIEFSDADIDKLSRLENMQNELLKRRTKELDVAGLAVLPLPNDLGEEPTLDNIKTFVRTDDPNLSENARLYRKYVISFNDFETCKRTIELFEELIREGKTDSKKPTRIKMKGTTLVNSFECLGDIWEIEYQGNRIAIQNMTGIRYIAMLLHSPNKNINCSDLIQQPGNKNNEGQILDIGLRITWGTNNDKQFDIKSINDAKKKLKQVDDQLEEDRQTEGTEAETEQLEDIKQKLEDYIKKSAYDSVNHPKKNKQMSNAVSKAIRESIKKVSKFDKELGNHLNNSIKTGMILIYSPEKSIQWKVSF